jgi:hypothetical protein
MAEAIRTDLVRSNPVSLAFNTRRMMKETPAHSITAMRLKRTSPVPVTQVAEHEPENHKWMRSSAIDTSDGRNQ